jgi:hypothetical protein
VDHSHSVAVELVVIEPGRQMTWEEIGAELGVTRERARQIGVAALRKLAEENPALRELAAAVERIRYARSSAQACIDEGSKDDRRGGYRHGDRHWSAR